MEHTVIGEGTRVQHFTLHKTQAETRWKHPNSKRQETFKACQSPKELWQLHHVGRTSRGTTIDVNAYCDTL
jgi:hypothetical protein